MRIRHALATAAVGTALALGTMTAPAQAAELSPQNVRGVIPSWCYGGEQWDVDGYTFGIRCDVTDAYYARVTCVKSGQTRTTTGVQTNDNRWSYAYCSSLGSGWRVKPGSGTAIRRA
ncbi:hypothetical protein [Streptomyces naphthomycinicus]|uniref:hypothetical protein n=1 Tax=Streptomyces naphthomycinicus TaxID=2872625 RepID=UPI001CECB835|nr:hypothetical protein [Streptomyces sp. TML10]